MDMTRLSLFFGRPVTSFSAPGLDQDGRQRVHIRFEDGRSVTGIGRTVGEAVINAGRRRLIKAVVAPIAGE